jgi:hypothetical protein
MQSKVLVSAHTHRGYLLWHASRSQRPDEWKESIQEMSEMSGHQLEEIASKDFLVCRIVWQHSEGGLATRDVFRAAYINI